jgi:hypothetical protein
METDSMTWSIHEICDLREVPGILKDTKDKVKWQYESKSDRKRCIQAYDSTIPRKIWPEPGDMWIDTLKEVS